VAKGAAKAADLSDGQSIPVLNDGNVTIGISDGSVTVTASGCGTKAMVITPDVVACNSIIHVIDAVLVPGDGCDVSPPEAGTVSTQSSPSVPTPAPTPASTPASGKPCPPDKPCPPGKCGSLGKICCTSGEEAYCNKGLVCGKGGKCEKKTSSCGKAGGKCCSDYNGFSYCSKGYVCKKDKCVKASCGNYYCACCVGKGKRKCKGGLKCSYDTCVPV
jgi:hypothetical protein